MIEIEAFEALLKDAIEQNKRSIKLGRILLVLLPITFVSIVANICLLIWG